MLVLQSLLVGLISTFAVWYAKFRWNRRHLYKLAAKIPGPNGLPLFGIALRIIGKNSQCNY